jgi:hypothetical protein
MELNMKMMSDARPNQSINLLTQCWPMIAAMNATTVKYAAKEKANESSP